jgi:predicted metalloprotease with PDZ domain
MRAFANTLRIFAALLLIALVAGCVTPQSAHRSPVDYTLRPVMAGGALIAIAVEMRFKGDASGVTVLELPSEWGGKDKLYEAIDGLAVSGGAAELSPVAKPQERIIHHQPGARLSVRYLVHHADEGAARNGNPYRPVIQTNRFQLLGGAVFAQPAGADDAAPARFHIEGMPAGWVFASNLERAGLTMRDVQESISVGGDFRILTRIVKGAQLRVAIDGGWAFTDDVFADTLAKISQSERDFWGDPGELFLVTVFQLETPPPGSISMGGTGRSGAFGLFATPNAEMSDILRTLAHEMMHTWIPSRIGTMPQDRAEAGEYWISEGFTDYYMQRMLVRSGVWQPAEFAAGLNKTLLRYAATPVRAAPNSRIAAEFWTDPNVEQLPYDRGMLFATLMDYRLRSASEGARDLDDVMHAMKASFARAPGPIRVRFETAMLGAGLDVHDAIATTIDAGTSILLPADTFAPCGQIVSEMRPPFDRGFDAYATRANKGVITGVEPKSRAFAAGLRNKMVLIKREAGEIGDSMKILSYRVKDGATERVISYLPQGPGEIEIQSLVLQPDSAGAELAACKSRLGGGAASQ